MGEIRRVLNTAKYQEEDGRMPDCARRREFSRLLRHPGIATAVASPHAPKSITANMLDPATVFRHGQLCQINDVFTQKFQVVGDDML